MTSLQHVETGKPPLWAVDPDSGHLKQVRRIEFTDGSHWPEPKVADAVVRYREAVLRTLADHAPHSFNDIRNRAGGDMISTAAALRALEITGRAVKVSRDRWQAAAAQVVA